MKALQALPPFSPLALSQRRSDLAAKLSPAYFRSTSWIALPHGSDLGSHLLPRASYLPPSLPSFLPAARPSKMTHSQERSRFLQFGVSCLKCAALCTAESLPPCHQLRLGFSLCVQDVRMYGQRQLPTAAAGAAGSSSALLPLCLSLTPHLSVVPTRPRVSLSRYTPPSPLLLSSSCIYFFFFLPFLSLPPLPPLFFFSACDQ